jgi:5S rRNA maturation endonuclease (ribonuclease M5)
MAISSSKDCPHCGSDHKGKPFALYEDGYHCFSCGSSKRAIRNFTLRGLEAEGDITLPELTLNPSMFSLPVLKWLRSYHVTDDLIYKHHIAESNGSVITPVLVDDKVVMYQQRWFDPRRIMTYGRKQPFIATNRENCDIIVIVEDFMSAIRVGETTDCYCMFGTSIPYGTLQSLVKRYDIIIVWTDGDSPGQKAAKKLSDTLNKLVSDEIRQRAFAYPFNKIVRNVLTDLDPKCYTNTDIRAILEQKYEVFHETNIKESS